MEDPKTKEELKNLGEELCKLSLDYRTNDKFDKTTIRKCELLAVIGDLLLYNQRKLSNILNKKENNNG